MSDLEGLRQSLEAQLDRCRDGVLTEERLVLADICEELGDQGAARFNRFLAGEEVHPHYFAGSLVDQYYHKWAWLSDSDCHQWAVLGVDLWDKVCGSPNPAFDSRLECEAHFRRYLEGCDYEIPEWESSGRLSGSLPGLE